MNGKITRLLLMILMAIIISVAAYSIVKPITKSAPGSAAKASNLTREDFAFLQPEMTYDEITARVGFPDSTTGTENLLSTYVLKDGSKVQLAFIPSLQLVSATIEHPDGSTENLISGSK